MNLKRSSFSIFKIERRKVNFIKGFYKRRVQSEKSSIWDESFKDTEDEDKKDRIQLQVVLMLNMISI